MAVVNIYKFAGLNANTDNTEKNPFGTNNPPVNETYLIKSIIVKSAGTPTPTVTNDGIVVIQLDLRNYPNNTAASSSLGPFTITSATTKVDTRARARAVALTISNTAVDTSWKLGTFRLDIHAGGRR